MVERARAVWHSVAVVSARMRCLQLVLLLVIGDPPSAHSPPAAINPEKMVMQINDTHDSLSLVWGSPDDAVNPLCYRTTLQYRGTCASQWESVVVGGFSFTLPAPARDRAYVFRLRMRYDCLYGDWSPWTAEAPSRPRPHTAPCRLRGGVAQMNRSSSILLSAALLTCVLVCALSPTRIRRCLLPIIPHPKHTEERILNINQSEWWDRLDQRHEEEECHIEMVSLRESPADLGEVSEEDGPDEGLTTSSQTTDTLPEQTHPPVRDENSIYRRCDSETLPEELPEMHPRSPRDAPAASYQPTLAGYVVI